MGRKRKTKPGWADNWKIAFDDKPEKSEWRKHVYGKHHAESGLEMSEWKDLRNEIIRRDQYTCYRCKNKKRAMKTLSVHHLIPRMAGGDNDPRNLVTLCLECHDYVEMNDLRSLKEIEGSYIPEEGLLVVTLKEKQEKKWDETFERPEWHKYVYGGHRHSSESSEKT